MNKYEKLIHSIVEKTQSPSDYLKYLHENEDNLHDICDKIDKAFENQENNVEQEFTLIKKIFSDLNIELESVGRDIDEEIYTQLFNTELKIYIFKFEHYLEFSARAFFKNETDLEDNKHITKIIKDHPEFENLEHLDLKVRSGLNKLDSELNKYARDIIKVLKLKSHQLIDDYKDSKIIEFTVFGSFTYSIDVVKSKTIFDIQEFISDIESSLT